MSDWTLADWLESMSKHICDCGHKALEHNMTCDIDRLGMKNDHPCHYCSCKEYQENGKVFNE